MNVKTDQSRILFVDDEEMERRAVTKTLERSGYTVVCAGNGSAARAILEQQTVDVVLLDLMLPGENGLDLLAGLRSTYPELIVIMYTGKGSFEKAVRATQLGAFDFVGKTKHPERLLVCLRNAVEHVSMRRELSRALQRQTGMIGQSSGMQKLWRIIERVAPTEAAVLIMGESGTGKELVAQAIYSGSRRSAQAYVSVNCAAIPSSLAESELFGHRKGAFSGANEDRIGKFKLADNGTLFLDEIGEMDLQIQSKLLRALQSGEIDTVGSPHPATVNVRVIAATSRNLQQKVKDGMFLDALFYRLEHIVIHMPPLREQREDIPLLAEHFLLKSAQNNSIPIGGLDGVAKQALQSYEWPGNIRQLEHAIERLAIFADGRVITKSDVDECLAAACMEPSRDLQDYDTAKTAFEYKYFRQLMKIHPHNISAVARTAGLAYGTVHPKLKSLGLIEISDTSIGKPDS